MKNFGNLRRWFRDGSANGKRLLEGVGAVNAPRLPPLDSPNAVAHFIDMTVLGCSQTAFMPNLPMELERYIFELVAWSSRKWALKLVLVAKRVYIWIEPIIYAVLLFEQPDPLPTIRQILLSKPPSFLATHVKSLCFSHLEPGDGYDLLSACTGVTNFGCWTPDTNYHVSLIQPLVTALRPTRLSLPLNAIFDLNPDFSAPFFSNLTHLHVLDLPPRWNKWRGWGSLPCLTHLAFTRWSYHPDTTEALHRILKECELLKHLVLVVVGSWSDTPTTFDRAIVEDLRVAFVPVFLPLKDWEDVAMGGKNNMWAEAERMAAKKRMKALLQAGM